MGSESEEFSLTNRGPLDRALSRVGLPSVEPPRLLLRAFVPALVIWIPLLVLAIIRPQDGAGAAISFFQDLATHVRFLIVVPLLVMIEAGIRRRTRMVAAHFVNAELITAADRPKFETLLRRMRGALESNLAETIIMLIAVAFVVAAVYGFAADGVRFWFESETPNGGTELTAAGWWYALGSWMPPFLFLRWAWRYLVWCWFMQRVAGLNLQIVATHPDRSAGLAFVSFGHTAFANLGLAMSCLVSGAVGTKILHEGATLISFKWMFVVFIGLSIILGMAPLAVFVSPLRRAKESGLLEYGSLSSRYVLQFHRKWIGTKAGEHPLEARDDIGPLADIGASFDRVSAMRLLPITLKNALVFAALPLLPLLPLLLTVMPLADLLKLLVQAMI